MTLRAYRDTEVQIFVGADRNGVLWRPHASLIGSIDFDFCLRTSTHFWTTSTDEVAWPQRDQLLGGGPWHKANLPATHWLSLPFYTPEGAWPLSQSTWVQRWGRDQPNGFHFRFIPRKGAVARQLSNTVRLAHTSCPGLALSLSLVRLPL